MPNWKWVFGQLKTLLIFGFKVPPYLHDVGNPEQKGHAADCQDEQLLPLKVAVQLLAVAVLQAGHHHFHHAELEGHGRDNNNNKNNGTDRRYLSMVYYREVRIPFAGCL